MEEWLPRGRAGGQGAYVNGVVARGSGESLGERPVLCKLGNAHLVVKLHNDMADVGR
jgi:hypothetical protein